MAPAAIIPPDHGHGHHADHKPPSSPDGSSSQSSIRHTYTHLTYSRHHLVDTAMETIKIAEEGQYTNSRGRTVRLKDDLDRAVDNCVHYEHDFDFHAALKAHDLRRAAGQSMGSLDESGGSASSSDCPQGALKLSFGGKGRSRRFPRTYFLVVSASWLESASELLGASSVEGGGEKSRKRRNNLQIRQNGQRTQRTQNLLRRQEVP